MLWVAIWGLTAISAAMIAGALAGIKNRDYSYWMGWCALVPPLVLFLAFLPKRQGPRPRRPSLDDEDHRSDRLL
jgi:hypothetical protein